MSSLYGKSTGFTDMYGQKVYEFDRIINDDTDEKATVIYRDMPFPGVIPYALKDDGTFVPLDKFGFYFVDVNGRADHEFCSKFDYRRN